MKKENELSVYEVLYNLEKRIEKIESIIESKEGLTLINNLQQLLNVFNDNLESLKSILKIEDKKL